MTKNNDDTSYQQFLEHKLLELSKSLKNDMHFLVDAKIMSWRKEFISGNQNLGKLSPSSFSANYLVDQKRQPGSKIHSHVFVARPSILNELLTVNHIQGIYNILIAILGILFMSEVLEGYVHNGSINLDLSLISYSFGKPGSMFIIWAAMKLSTILTVYTFFYVWASFRHRLPTVFDVTALAVYAIYLLLFLQWPVKSLLAQQLPPTSSFIILCEQARLIMKTWAFVRSNVPRAHLYKKDDSAHATLCPAFSSYLYYLFAPTLVYRDTYPRSKTCNWNNVLKDLIQIVGCIVFANFLFTRCCLPIFQSFGKETFTKTKLMVCVFSCCFPGSLLFLLGFFMFLHCWMNVFAEILRFSDRMFYKDWWNSTSYSRFYRTWNCVVHDWLYEYVYKDVTQLHCKLGISANLGRHVAMLVVFFISASVHEFILAFSLRFFYPVLLTLFGSFGVVFMFVGTKSAKFNIFLWFTLMLGMGIMVCLYFMEWYARVNCPPIFDGLLDLVVPRSWFCHM